MLTKAQSTAILPKDEASYMEALSDALREMQAVRKRMRKTDSEIRRLGAQSRRNLDETWAALRRVQATV